MATILPWAVISIFVPISVSQWSTRFPVAPMDFSSQQCLYGQHIVISLEERGVCFRNKAGYDLGLYGSIYVEINKQIIQPEVVLIEGDIIIKINS